MLNCQLSRKSNSTAIAVLNSRLYSSIVWMWASWVIVPSDSVARTELVTPFGADFVLTIRALVRKRSISASLSETADEAAGAGAWASCAMIRGAPQRAAAKHTTSTMRRVRSTGLPILPPGTADFGRLFPSNARGIRNRSGAR